MKNRFAILLSLLIPAAVLADGPAIVGKTFSAMDTVDVGKDPSADARECLAGLIWDASSFEVRCEPPRKNRGDLLVRFPSPRPSGDLPNDQVAMEWYMARDDDQQPIRACCGRRS